MKFHCTEIKNYSIERKTIANKPVFLKYIWLWITRRVFVPLYHYRIYIEFVTDFFSDNDIVEFVDDESLWIVKKEDGKTFIENINPMQFKGIGNNIIVVERAKTKIDEAN